MIMIFGNVIVPLKKRIKEVYEAAKVLDKNEAAYAAYRYIMCPVEQDSKKARQESWRYCKPLIKEWEGKK
jgi:hypothetical protein